MDCEKNPKNSTLFTGELSVKINCEKSAVKSEKNCGKKL